MKNKNSLRHKLHRLTYDNPKVNQTVVSMRRSFDEVNQFLNGKEKPGSSKK